MRLKLQLEMLHDGHKRLSSVPALVNCLQEMSLSCRAMFGEVIKLMQLILICPVSSCEAERSFSVMRRLKTWLRNTMSQTLLNTTAVCHVHVERLQMIPSKTVAMEFISRNDQREKFLENFKFLFSEYFIFVLFINTLVVFCLLYTSPSPRD